MKVLSPGTPVYRFHEKKPYPGPVFDTVMDYDPARNAYRLTGVHAANGGKSVYFKPEKLTEIRARALPMPGNPIPWNGFQESAANAAFAGYIQYFHGMTLLEIDRVVRGLRVVNPKRAITAGLVRDYILDFIDMKSHKAVIPERILNSKSGT